MTVMPYFFIERMILVKGFITWIFAEIGLVVMLLIFGKLIDSAPWYFQGIGALFSLFCILYLSNAFDEATVPEKVKPNSLEVGEEHGI